MPGLPSKPPAGPLVFQILREDDLLTLQFEAYNLHLDTKDSTHPKLVVTNPAERAFLVVRFPPQTILEQAYFEVAPGLPDGNPSATPDAPGSVQKRMAGTSRLVFRLPQATRQIPYTIDGLLDWSQLELILSATARGQPPDGPLTAPAPLETAIELPFRVILSPVGAVGWAHASKPRTHAGRTELWHTRLLRAVDTHDHGHTRVRLEELTAQRTVALRAIWSPDYVDHQLLPPPSVVNPFPAAMSPRDRAQIVVLTSGFKGYFVPGDPPTAWVPQPVHAERLFLSPLGGWLTSHGGWPSPPSYYTDSVDSGTQSLDLSEWRHVATAGRDHYVKIVTEGFLYPFGHRAALVKVTERKVEIDPSGIPVAYLRQHMYVVVREREKAYDPAAFQHAGREMPFLESVRIETTVTPDIDSPIPIQAGSTSFWVEVGGAAFPFHVRARDAAGSRVDLLAQLLFVSIAEPSIPTVQSAHRVRPDRRACPVGGRKVAYVSTAAALTTLRTTSVTFDTQILQPAPPYTAAPFLPTLDLAAVTVPALEQLTGMSAPVDVRLYTGYLATGLDLFAGVFAQIDGTPPSITFSADRAGGFATPNLALTALSAHKGVVAGSPDDAAAGLINPKDFFGNVTFPGKIFGTVPLADLIPVPNGTTAAAGPNAPTIRNHLKPNAKAATTSVTEVHWEPQLQDYKPAGSPVMVEFNQNGVSAFKINAKNVRSLTGAAPTTSITGDLSNFRLSLLGVVALQIDSISFKSSNGAKPDVKATLPKDSPIVFEGALAFVQALATIIPPGIFGGKGPSIDLKPKGLHVSYTLAFPSVPCGIFALEHISITVGLMLPYVDGKPSFEFSFAKRSSPFLLTIECLGGGGFVGLVIDADGVQMVEGALEFGAEMSFDIGIGSGGVHIMAGIYFQLKTDSTELTGFVDIGGELSIFGGLISVSIDLNLSLTYHSAGGKSQVTGRATLTISVHIIFFSVHVSMSVEKSFGSDPETRGSTRC